MKVSKEKTLVLLGAVLETATANARFEALTKKITRPETSENEFHSGIDKIVNEMLKAFEKVKIANRACLADLDAV